MNRADIITGIFVALATLFCIWVGASYFDGMICQSNGGTGATWNFFNILIG